MKNILKEILYFVLPNYCLLCQRKAEKTRPLCDLCENESKKFIPGCQRCGLVLSNAACVCGTCQKRPPSYSRLIVGVPYRFPFDHCVTQLKFHQRFLMADILAYLLARQVNQSASPLPDFIVPVPLHITRLKERGFNQADFIAKRLQKYLPVKILQKACYKIQATAAQTELSGKQRIKNLRGVFAAEKRLDNLHLAIVDDVVTTGTTVEALAKVLINNGARQVDVWAATRTMRS